MTPTISSVSPPPATGSRRSRLRRTLLISAAALAVVTLPTACDYAIASETADHGGLSSGAAGSAAPHSGQQGTQGRQTPVAVTSRANANPNSEGPAADQANEASQAAAAPSSAAPATSASPASSGRQQTNGLDVLARDCSKSNLQPHTGFQDGNRCVETEFGEVGSADKNPSLLITSAPRSVRAGQPFELKVTTRNLVRDRFLGAAAGGYYLETSLLNADGIQRGHFHTACRMLPSTDTAPDAAPDPEFFLATQDNKGGAGADTVTITVPGLKTKGIAQCSSWAGDGSHRIPMTQRANQTPAFDSVRIEIT